MSSLLARSAGFIRARVANACSLVGHRALVFFRWTTLPYGCSATESVDIRVECVSSGSFRDLDWNGNKYVFEEACDWRGPGERVALAAFVEGSTLAGFCWLEIQSADLRFFGISMPLASGVGYLSRVWVDDRARGRGIGSALIAGLQAEAVRRGLSDVIGACVPENSRMRSIFSNSGWKEYAAVHRYFVPTLSIFRVRFPFRTDSLAISAVELGRLIWPSNPVKGGG